MNAFSSYFDKVLRFLSVRSRSEYEINFYMLKKGWGEEVRNKILVKLKDLQLIDDEDFAKQWIEHRTAGRPEGLSLVRMELRRKGVDKEIIDKLLSEKRGSEQEEYLAEKYGRKKMERLKSLPVFEVKKKLYSALMARGFNGEVIRRLIAKLLGKE